MRALMKWGVAMTTHFPTHMISMHTGLPWLDIGSACSDVVLHTYRLVVALTKLHDTSIWNLNLALTWSSFAISFLSAFSFVLRRSLCRWIRLKTLIAACGTSSLI